MPENYISKFSPNSWFFTEPEKLSQTAGQSFGPSSANEFVLTNRFNIAPAGAKGFAICKGVVRIQPQTGDPSKVNLVLRPFNQPVQGFNIRYFIYRGLNLDDFFAGNKIKPDSNVASDFIKKINKDFTDYHSRFNSPIPEFLSSYIGFGVSLPNNTPLPDSTPVDYFFFKDSDYVVTNGESQETPDTAFELPVIDGGKWLGNFSGGNAGWIL